MRSYSISNIYKQTVALCVAATFSVAAFAQSKELAPQIIQYIETYRGIAQEEMLRSGVPASITLAQGIHESNIGKSVLATEAKNHFGIKCHKEWAGPTYTYDDDEKGECFRVYNNAEHSYRDHSDFLTSRPRYAQLFTLDRNDYKGWSYGLKAAGYATNPKYPEILVRLIEEYKLHEYDDFNNAVYAMKTPAVEVPQPVAEVVAPTQPVEVELPAIGSHNGVASIVLEKSASPAQVAAKYNIKLSELLAFNEMNDGDVFPANSRVYFAEKKKSGASSFHTAAQGESMWIIAQMHGIKLSKLYEKNRMKMNDQVAAGETVYLQEKRSAAPQTLSYEAFLKAQQPMSGGFETALKPTFSEDKLVTASIEKLYVPVTSKVPVANTEISSDVNFSNANVTRYYEVQPKETLYAISRMFNVSVEQLREWNNLQGNEIRIGQELIVGK